MPTRTQPAKASGEFLIGGKLPVTRLGYGTLQLTGPPLETLAQAHGSTPPQLALAWLLHRSPVMLPIPGTASVRHLEENIAAARVKLSDREYAALESAIE